MPASPDRESRGPRRAKLASRKVREGIKPEAVRFLVWDADEPGLGMDVWPSGTRSWVLFLRVQGVQRRITLGSVDGSGAKSAITRDEAMRRARALRVAADEGRDPMIERRARRVEAVTSHRQRQGAPTFADVAESYLATLRAKRSPRWAREAERILEKDVLPKLGGFKVAELGVAHVRALHESMAARPFLANRAKAVVSAVMARALEDGLRPAAAANPAHQVENYAEPERKRVLTAAEWKALAEAWPLARDEFAEAPAWDTRRTQLQAIEAIALTGSRVGAVLPRRVGDFDLERHIVAVAPTHKHVSRLFLGEAAVRVIAPSLAGRGAREFAFPGQERREGERRGRGAMDTRTRRAPAPISSAAPAWTRLRDLAGLEDVWLEDFRTQFATIGPELGFSTFIVGGVLGHSEQGVTERHYSGRPDALLLAAADAIAAEVARRLGLTERRTARGKK